MGSLVNTLWYSNLALENVPLTSESFSPTKPQTWLRRIIEKAENLGVPASHATRTASVWTLEV
jgi:hypothetical protein